VIAHALGQDGFASVLDRSVAQFRPDGAETVDLLDQCCQAGTLAAAFDGQPHGAVRGGAQGQAQLRSLREEYRAFTPVLSQPGPHVVDGRFGQRTAVHVDNRIRVAHVVIARAHRVSVTPQNERYPVTIAEPAVVRFEFDRVQVYLAYAAERIFDDGHTRRALRIGGQVLELAAAAAVVVRAGRAAPVGTGLDDPVRRGPPPLAMLFGVRHLDKVARCRAGDEHNEAIRVARDAVAPRNDGLDAEAVLRFRCFDLRAALQIEKYAQNLAYGGRTANELRVATLPPGQSGFDRPEHLVVFLRCRLRGER
jgi:hypothetical protein